MTQDESLEDNLFIHLQAFGWGVPLLTIGTFICTPDLLWIVASVVACWTPIITVHAFMIPVAGWRGLAGLVLLRQRPSTAKGITFMTLEDETGQANLIVRPEVWERYRRVARSAGAMIVTGFLQRQEGVIHILVDRMQDLSSLIRNVGSLSRDFH